MKRRTSKAMGRALWAVVCVGVLLSLAPDADGTNKVAVLDITEPDLPQRLRWRGG